MQMLKTFVAILLLVFLVGAVYFASYHFLYSSVDVFQLGSKRLADRACKHDVPVSLEVLFKPIAWIEARVLGVDHVILHHFDSRWPPNKSLLRPPVAFSAQIELSGGAAEIPGR